MSQAELFIKPLTSWMDGSGTDSDIVLSSRVRLARNICQIPFPNRANIAQLSKVEENVEEIIPELAEATGKQYQAVKIDQLSTLERNVLVEKHMISTNHIMNPENRLAVVSEDEKN